MKTLYSIAGMSKQAYHKSQNRTSLQEQIAYQVIENFITIRKNHRRMSCRKMYHVEGFTFPVGRDIAEQIGFANGFKVHLKRSPVKTTWSQRVEVYPNLIDGIVLTNINQVWQSDLFYLMVEGKHYYGIGIQDIYSRRLVALKISSNMMAEQNVLALRKAIKSRATDNLEGCVFHSDRGSQYISKQHKNLLLLNNMLISMCKLPQENAYIERLNGILKQEYFDHFKLTHKNINIMAKKIMKLYNFQRPHEALNNMTPEAFEQKVRRMGDNQRPKLQLHQWNSMLSTENQVVNKEKSSKKENLPNT